jgi:hypothetical protein
MRFATRSVVASTHLRSRALCAYDRSGGGLFPPLLASTTPGLAQYPSPAFGPEQRTNAPGWLPSRVSRAAASERARAPPSGLPADPGGVVRRCPLRSTRPGLTTQMSQPAPTRPIGRSVRLEDQADCGQRSPQADQAESDPPSPGSPPAFLLRGEVSPGRLIIEYGEAGEEGTDANHHSDTEGHQPNLDHGLGSPVDHPVLHGYRHEDENDGDEQDRDNHGGGHSSRGLRRACRLAQSIVHRDRVPDAGVPSGSSVGFVGDTPGGDCEMTRCV